MAKSPSIGHSFLPNHQKTKADGADHGFVMMAKSPSTGHRFPPKHQMTKADGANHGSATKHIFYVMMPV